MVSGYTRGPRANERLGYVRFIPIGQLRHAMMGRSNAIDVLAIVPCFNEEDIIAATVRRLRSQGVRVHLIENWSTDTTWRIVAELCRVDPGVTAERFPDAPSSEHQWQRILDRMDEFGAESDADWILHVDADEVLESYSPSVTLREAIATADAAGFDAFDCTVVDFRPTAASPGADGILPEYWEFGQRHGHRHIERAWRNRGQLVGLSVAGGHIINEPKRLFPLNLLLRHYPLRSAEHAVRKIFRDRLPRFQNSPGQLEHGWHRQYDGFRRDDPFLWDTDVLQRWAGDSTRERWMVEMTTKVGLSFGEGSYATSPFAEPTRSRRWPNVDAARRRWRVWREH
jgi:glycosyltransferase involved in cell wall biosynthesis